MGLAQRSLSVLCIALLVLRTAPVAESANIVFFFGFSSYSHLLSAWPLVESLADQGHNVTFVASFTSKTPHPKVFSYAPKTLKEWVEKFGEEMNFFEERKKSFGLLSMWAILPFLGSLMCEEVYKDTDFVNWVKTTEVDLVFVDALSNDCAYGMAHYWKAKTIMYSTSTAFTYFYNDYGLPDESSWIPTMELPYSANMTFLQRVTTALNPVFWHYYRTLWYYPKMEALAREKLGTVDLPPFTELERNTSLVFLNTHFSEEFARSLPPNVVPIGGIAYVEKRKPLPKDLEEFLSKGNGFIYMSFGTQTDFLRMDKSTQQAFIGAMQNFPDLQFVWKVNDLSLVEKFPKKNVFISKWMPQQEILSHPKIRAFITHSGLLSLQETIFHSVPPICFPFFAEQDYNAERINRKEYGIRLEITTVTQPEIEDAIQRITTDPKYANNMKKVSKIFKDRPSKPLETALWWTEFVLRYSQEELTALRPLSVHQSWWVRRQLDVWAAIFGLTAISTLGLLYLFYKLLKRLFSTKRSSDVRKKKNQ